MLLFMVTLQCYYIPVYLNYTFDIDFGINTELKLA